MENNVHVEVHGYVRLPAQERVQVPVHTVEVHARVQVQVQVQSAKTNTNLGTSTSLIRRAELLSCV